MRKQLLNLPILVGVAATALVSSALAQPMQPTVTTRTVTTVTTMRNGVPQGTPMAQPMSPAMEGRVVYDGQAMGREQGQPQGQPQDQGMPMERSMDRPMRQGEALHEDGQLFYPETYVWQANPQEFPRDWHHGNAPVYRHHAHPIHAPQPLRVLTHHRQQESTVAVSRQGGPVPVMVQVVAPDGYRDTVPAVIRPSGVPTVVRATGANPPPVYYEMRGDMHDEPRGTAVGAPMGQGINWAQERQQGMPMQQPMQGHWYNQQGENDRGYDAPPPPQGYGQGEGGWNR